MKSMNSVEEVQVVFHKVMGIEKYPEIGQGVGKTSSVFTTTMWVIWRRSVDS